MKKELTFFELLRLLFALILAIAIFIITTELDVAFVPNVDGLSGFTLFLLIDIFLPPFFAILVACVIPSWRYRTIAATMMLMLVTSWHVLNLLFAFSSLPRFLAALIRLSVGMSGALVAVLIWQTLKQRFFAKAKPLSVAAEPGKKIPTSSVFLLLLSLASIPATYVTIFISAFLVVGYSAFLLLNLFALPGGVPIVLIAGAVLAPLIALWAAFRALGAILRPRPPFQPAHRLDLTTHPLTKATIDEVCTAVKTRKPDHVLLHAEPTFFVTQQKIHTFDGLVQGRTLALGMPLLPYLTNQEFQAILAHEFAHFSGRDTLYSIWVAQVYRGLGESIRRLRGSMATSRGMLGLIMNLLLFPSLLFLGIFFEFFASLDAIISRTRELRADWIAVRHCGRDAFISALQKVVQYSNHFSEHQKEIGIEKPTEIFQAYRFLVHRDEENLQTYLDKAMNAVEHEFASHPTLRTRLNSLPVHAGALANNEVAFQNELLADEEKLSSSVTEMMRQFQALYAAAQERAVPARALQ